MVLICHVGEKNSSTCKTGKGKESEPTNASSLENFHSRDENDNFHLAAILLVMLLEPSYLSRLSIR